MINLFSKEILLIYHKKRVCGVFLLKLYFKAKCNYFESRKLLHTLHHLDYYLEIGGVKMVIDVILTRFIEWDNKYIMVEKSYKSSDLACIPRVGDGWEDGSFVVGGIPQVDEVVFNYDNGHCIVYLENHLIENINKHIESIIRLYEEGNWTIGDTLKK
ncbi:hypothetical protein [Lysinibacillus capsici]|uniref:hypothetical protein n=1 Tax=Lysinibacillus capsici TaxID=2115968 RepID=UPI0034E5E611